jgi:hypothetical protein
MSYTLWGYHSHIKFAFNVETERSIILLQNLTSLTQLSVSLILSLLYNSLK